MRLSKISGLLLAFAAALCAQGDRGTITGTISDPAGAVVANAAIEAKHVETGTVYQTTSSSSGNYTLGELPVGSFQITVTVPGFKRYTRAGLTVQVAGILRIDIPLEVGSASEQVTVTAAAALLNTESGEVSHNVTTEMVDSLPILPIGTLAGSSAIRNPQSEAYLVPGTYVVPNSVLRVNGAPGNTAALRIEGQDATNAQAGPTPAQSQPSVDAIQEVTVQTSNFAAEYGQVGGGFFNYTMKSGTNQLHGSVYDYLANEAFNANVPWVNTKPRVRRNDYGFTAGGPVVFPKIYNGRNRTFFFFNWEQYREKQTVTTQYLTVPTAAYRAGNFATALTGRTLGTDPLGRSILEGGVYDPNTQRTAPSGQLIRDAFPGNLVPATRLDPVSLKINTLIPLPNLTTCGACLVNNALFPFPTQRHTEIPAFKIDHTISPRAKLSYYWHETKTASQYSATMGGADGLPIPATQDNGTFVTSFIQRANFEYSFTPTLLFHAGVGYMTDHFTDNTEITNFYADQILGLKGLPKADHEEFPYLTGMCPSGVSGTSVAVCTGQGGMKVIGPSTNRDPLMYEKPTGNLSLTWVRGNHTYKAGAEMRVDNNLSNIYVDSNGSFAFSPNETGLPYLQSSTLGGGTVGFSYASFMLGQVDSLQVAPQENMHLGKHQIGAFVQDSWKVTRKLTLDYGLRYDYQTYNKEDPYAPFAQFAPNIPNPSAGGQPGAVQFEGSGPGRCNCSLANNYPLAFGPRLGVAYQITPKTVIRGGWGLVFASTPDSFSATQGAYSVPPPVTATSFGQPVMTLAQGIPAGVLTPFPNFNVGQYPNPAYVGAQAPGYFLDQNAGRPPRQDQWSVGLQRELGRDLAVEVNYIANRGVWWNAPQFSNPNTLTPELLAARGLNLNNAADVQLLSSPLNSALAASRGFNKPPFTGFPATLTVAQSLRPFPQFNTIIAAWAPNGNTWYDALQEKATKRFSHGLQFTQLFSWGKSLTTAAPTQVFQAGSNPTDGGAARNDIFNRPQNKYLSPYDQPLVLTIAASYTSPKLSINKLASWVARDWQLSTLLSYSSGLPILAPAAQNNLNTVLLRANSSTLSYANRVPGVPLFTQDLNCHCFDPNKTFVLNPAAWKQPAAGQWGTGAAYYDDYRFQRHPNESIGLGRAFRVKERMQLNVRMEFANIFNRAEVPNPTSTNSAATQLTTNGVAASGFGQIATANIGAATSTGTPSSRQGTLVARFTF